jgi:hypothetical protein
MSDDTKTRIHQGPDHSAPYPVSRLAPAFGGTDLAAEVAQAEAMLGARTGAKLRVIADQIKALQEEARRVLAQAREEQALTRAQCAFKPPLRPRPGRAGVRRPAPGVAGWCYSSVDRSPGMAGNRRMKARAMSGSNWAPAPFANSWRTNSWRRGLR